MLGNTRVIAVIDQTDFQLINKEFRRFHGHAVLANISFVTLAS